MVYPDKIETLNAMTGIVTTTRVEGGYPAIEYPNHLLYDVLTGQLISYFYNEQRVSYFSFDKGTWSLTDRSLGKAHDYNHARAYNPSDSSYYFFGGYGFHQYHNHLYRLKVGDSKIERITYQPLIEPRFRQLLPWWTMNFIYLAVVVTNRDDRSWGLLSIMNLI